MSGIRSQRWSWGGLFLALLAASLWGLAPVATKAALQGFSPEFIGVFRLTVAAALFRLLGGPGTPWFAADRWAWLGGVALGTDFILYNYGVQRTSANAAGLVINAELVFTIALAVWLLGERLSRHRLIGSAVTLCGVLVVTLDGVSLADWSARERIVGNVLVIGAGAAWSVFAVAQRRAHGGRNLFQRLTPIFSVAALTALPPLCVPHAWALKGGLMPSLMLAVLTVLGTGLVYFVYARAQQMIDVSVLAVLLCSIPMFAVAFAYLLLGEPVSARLGAGALTVVGGIVILGTEKNRAPEPEVWEAESLRV